MAIQLRRDSAADWTSNDPTLSDGQPGYESDTGKWKIGDGSTAWTSLAYQTGLDGLALTAVVPQAADQALIQDNSDSDNLKTTTAGEIADLINGKQTIYLPASAMTAATTSGPASTQLETTTNKINYAVFDFDATADEYVHFTIGFPKSWNLGAVTFQVFWESTAVGTTGVAWGLQGVSITDNVTQDTAYGTAVVVTDDAQSAAGELYVTAESAAVTIAATPVDDDLCHFRLFRDVSDANDDMTEDARLVGIKLFYTTDTRNDD